ncbi:hypothetical protein C8R43DRAFT_966974 [Mycena crocata]|nr:hypothetical protein C8R43DRAFT_966974 [Mycena crocata]
MSTNESELDPRLPADLEREIFELAAETHLPGIPRLLLVAQRVKIWTEPILYRTFIVCETWRYLHQVGEDVAGLPQITPKKILQLLDTRPAVFDHVRHLFLIRAGNALNDFQRILAACNGVQDFFLDGTPDLALFLALAAISPQRLHIRQLYHLFPSDRVDYTHSLFSKVTHLDLDRINFPSDPAGLAALPCLTHLAVDHTAAYVHLEGALAHCARLAVLVVVRWEEPDANQSLLAHFAHEPRFVLLFAPEDPPMRRWRSGALGGEDHWTRAEAVVRERQLRNNAAWSSGPVSLALPSFQ